MPPPPIDSGSSELGIDMFIAAHPDDSLLFMNPTLQKRIDAGGQVIAIDLTAGDAGEGPEHWQEREIGKKAAFALMAGSSDWVDETVTLTVAGHEFEIVSSYLESRPEIRLYFLRLPDGFGDGSGADTYGFQSLQGLWDGSLTEVTSVDGTSTYSAAELVGVLTELMSLHGPQQLHLQDHDSELSGIEHSDHIHTGLFATAALAGYLAEVTVTSYVGYASWGFEENLTLEEYADVLAAFEAYAAHDTYVQNAAGGLLEPYAEWVQREMVANEYSLDAPPAEAAPGVFLSGTDNNDRLTGGDLNDFLSGDGGRDRLQGNAGADVLSGGLGSDKILGGAGDDLLIGGNGTDRLVGNSGDDTVIGGNGSDRALLGNGNDLWFDNDQVSGHDYVVGGRGNDTLHAAGGNDTLSGGEGSDCFVFADQIAHDVINDYELGVDTLKFSAALWNGPLDQAHLLTLATQAGPDLVLDFGDGNTLTLQGISGTDGLLDDISLL